MRVGDGSQVVKKLHMLAFAAVLVLAGSLGLLFQQDHASAADNIVIRARVDERGSIVIEREYQVPTRWVEDGVVTLEDGALTLDRDVFQSRSAQDGVIAVGDEFQPHWVTVGVITFDEPQDGDVFQYGAMTLSVEFIPEARLPLPNTGTGKTGFRTDPSDTLTCEETATRYDENGEVVESTRNCYHLNTVEVTCWWGWSATLGEFSLAGALEAGVFAMRICDHHGLLQELESPSEMITLEELRARIAAALTAQGEWRRFEDLPEPPNVIVSEPIRSETTYVDIRVLQVVASGDISVSVQARGGGVQRMLELDQPYTVAIYSLAQ